MRRAFLQPLLLCTLLASCRHRPAAPTMSAPGPIASREISVLLFIAPDCPISNAYVPEFNRIAAEYRGRGVRFTGVYCDPQLSADAMHRHAREYGLAFPVLLDNTLGLAKRVGATVTPEAAVLDPAGRVVYVGRTDDLFVTFGRRRGKPTTHELRDAIDASLDDRPAPQPAGPPIGCDLSLRG